MAAVAGALVVDLQAETATFNRDMGRAAARVQSAGARINRSLARVNKAFKRAGRSVAAFAKRNLSLRNAIVTLVGGAGLGLLIKRSIDAGDAIAKTADAVGISTDALQELRFAADLSGVSIEQFDKALTFATKAIGELRTRTSSELTTALKDFDAQLLENIRTATSLEVAIDLVFERMGQLEDQTKRAALAKAFFGRQGVILTNIVRGEADALDKMRAEARRLGLVLDEDLLRGAEGAKDQLAILGKVLSTVVTRAVLDHADAIANLAARFTGAIPKIAEFVDKFGQWLGLIEKAPVERLADIHERIRELQKLLGAPLGGLSELFGGGARLQELNALLAERSVLLKGLAEATTAVSRAQTTPAAAPAAFVDPFAGRGVPKRKPITIDIDRNAASLAKMRAEAEALVKIERRLKDAADAVFVETRTPMENYRGRIVELNRLRERSAINEDTYTRAVERAQDAMVAQNEIAQAGTRVFDNFGDGIIEAMQRGENAMESFRNVARAALFDVQRELIKTLVFDPFKKFAVSSLLGLFRGGVGGGGSQPIPIMAQHGARNTPAGQPFRVGEAGPETIIPPAGSRIVPNQGDSVTIVQHINVFPDVSTVARAQVLSMMPIIQEAASAGVADARRRDRKFFN